MSTRTCSEKEAKGNLEMAYVDLKQNDRNLIRFLLHKQPFWFYFVSYFLDDKNKNKQTWRPHRLRQVWMYNFYLDKSNSQNVAFSLPPLYCGMPCHPLTPPPNKTNFLPRRKHLPHMIRGLSLVSALETVGRSSQVARFHVVWMIASLIQAKIH